MKYDDINQTEAAASVVSQDKDPLTCFQVMADHVVHLYETACNDSALLSAGKKSDIYRLAEPLRTKNCSLAVMGRGHIEKFMFVDVLLENSEWFFRNSLFATSSVPVCICYGQTRKVQAVFGDHHQEDFTDRMDLLSERLAKELDNASLPVPLINDLFCRGLSMEEICSDRWIQEIEKQINCHIDAELLKAYLTDKTPDQMLVKLTVEYPLKEIYQGWRVEVLPNWYFVSSIKEHLLDMSTISLSDAIVYIETSYKENDSLIPNDAFRLFLDESLIEQQMKVFRVLSMKSDPDLQEKKEEALRKNSKLSEERLYPVHLLASLLAQNQQLDFKLLSKQDKSVLEVWKLSSGESCLDLMHVVRTLLENQDMLEFNNENIRNKLYELSDFQQLRADIRDFVIEKKNIVFKQLVKAVCSELNQGVVSINSEIAALEHLLGGSVQMVLTDIGRAKDKLNRTVEQITVQIEKIKKKWNQDYLICLFGKEDLFPVTSEKFKPYISLEDMSKIVLQLEEKMNILISDIQKQVLNDVSVIEEIRINQKLTLSLIDLKERLPLMENRAIEDSKRYYQRRCYSEKTSAFSENLGDLIKDTWLETDLKYNGVNLNDFGKNVRYETVCYTDFKLAAQSFCNSMNGIVLNRLEQIYKELQNYFFAINEEIALMIAGWRAEYELKEKPLSVVSQINRKKEEKDFLLGVLSDLEHYQ